VCGIALVVRIGREVCEGVCGYSPMILYLNSVVWWWLPMLCLVVVAKWTCVAHRHGCRQVCVENRCRWPVSMSMLCFWYRTVTGYVRASIGSDQYGNEKVLQTQHVASLAAVCVNDVILVESLVYFVSTTHLHMVW
jgi:hypothetical protein